MSSRNKTKKPSPLPEIVKAHNRPRGTHVLLETFKPYEKPTHEEPLPKTPFNLTQTPEEGFFDDGD